MQNRKLEREASRISALRKSVNIATDRISGIVRKLEDWRGDRGCAHLKNHNYKEWSEQMLVRLTIMADRLREEYNDIQKLLAQEVPEVQVEDATENPEVPADLY